MTTAPAVYPGRADSGRLILAVPSKGRMMEQTARYFERAGLTLRKTGPERGYRADIAELPGIEVALVSASEIARMLRSGEVHMGVTGEDLVRETIPNADELVRFEKRLGFGQADVVVAVPDGWIDVTTMRDLDEIAEPFRRAHRRRLKVATKYMGLTRAFFADRGVAAYRLVESLGATEGAPASGLADLIVDITSSGATLKANALRVLDDGIILKSEANLLSSRVASWSDAQRAESASLLARLPAALG
jgi:ATP phosphoribosyltransferase